MKTILTPLSSFRWLTPMCGLILAAPQLARAADDSIGQSLQKAMIWSPSALPGKQAYVAFRKSFALQSAPASAKDGVLLDNGTGCRAHGVVAVRFEFQDGPLGFNVYREINLAGQPTK